MPETTHKYTLTPDGTVKPTEREITLFTTIWQSREFAEYLQRRRMRVAELKVTGMQAAMMLEPDPHNQPSHPLWMQHRLRRSRIHWLRHASKHTLPTAAPVAGMHSAASRRRTGACAAGRSWAHPTSIRYALQRHRLRWR